MIIAHHDLLCIFSKPTRMPNALFQRSAEFRRILQQLILGDFPRKGKYHANMYQGSR